MKRVLVTGTAGFIGFHLARRLVDLGYHVTGLDSINEYYDVALKYDRLEQSGISRDEVTYNQLVTSTSSPNYQFVQLQLQDRDLLFELFANRDFEVVVNLAAQAGVRYSLTHPQVYIDSNITLICYFTRFSIDDRIIISKKDCFTPSSISKRFS